MAYCAYCDAVFKFKRMTEQMQKECKDFDYYENVGRWKLWQFSGLALFMIFVLWLMIQSRYDEERQMERRQNPKIGNLYQTKLNESRYTYFKIVKINKDSIGFVRHLGHTKKLTDIMQLKKVEYYSDTLIMYFKKEVIRKFETGYFINAYEPDK